MHKNTQVYINVINIYININTNNKWIEVSVGTKSVFLPVLFFYLHLTIIESNVNKTQVLSKH